MCAARLMPACRAGADAHACMRRVVSRARRWPVAAGWLVANGSRNGGGAVRVTERSFCRGYDEPLDGRVPPLDWGRDWDGGSDGGASGLWG